MSRLIIDAHQHIWDPSRVNYDWLGPEFEVLNRTFTFDELKPQLHESGVTNTVIVQSADNHEDTTLMLESAAVNKEISAIVGYLPLDKPAVVEKILPEWLENPLFVGVRNLIHTKDDPNWLLQDQVLESLSLLEHAGYTLDIVAVFPRHINLIPTISDKFPNLNMVIDHLGKPPSGKDEFISWKEQIRVAAQNPRVYAKVSGLYGSPKDSPNETAQTFQQAFNHVLSEFGSQRLMYGGDWPINLLDGGYAKSWAVFKDLVHELDHIDQDEIFSQTAIRFYGIPEEQLNRNV